MRNIQSGGITVLTMLINLKSWIGVKFACNIFALWKKIHVS